MLRSRPTRWRAPCSMPAANWRRAPANCAPKSSAFWRRCASLSLFSIVPNSLGVIGPRQADIADGALGGGEISHVGEVLHADLRIPALGVVAEHGFHDGRARNEAGIGRAAERLAVVGDA